jgi:arabinofuranosyltransferase
METPRTAVSPRLTSWALWLSLLALLLLALTNAFVVDDAFISFRYADNLVQSGELAWNPGQGDPVEGYTNFLWTVMMAAPIAAGIDPVGASMVLGLVFAAGTLLLTFQTGRLLFRSRSLALLTLILVGTNYTLSAYATSGLETQMQTFLVIAGTYLALSIGRCGGPPRAGSVVGLSLLCALAILTRLDSTIPYAVLYAYVVLTISRLEVPRAERLSALIWLALPVLAILVPWLVWKHAYYGSVLPNTYHVRAASVSRGILVLGALYIHEFLRSYLLYPFVFIGAAFLKGVVSRTELRVLLVIVALWSAYTVKVGGDFMEFRFLVPVLPLAFLLVVDMIRRIDMRKLQVALVAMVLVGSLVHATTYRGSYGTESVSQLRGHIVDEDQDWRRVGAILSELFAGEGEPVIIATTAAGAIPYYSRLQTVDMLGINDRWVATEGLVVSPSPGHERRAPLEHLVDRGVNLVIGHPQIEPASSVLSTAYSADDLARFELHDVDPHVIPPTSRVIEIPLDAHYKITVLYLNRHGHVDEVAARLGLVSYEIERG